MNNDIKPMGWAEKSEIAQNADTKEIKEQIKEELKGELEGGTQDLVLSFATHGEYPDGTKWEREATPEEQARYESWSK